MNCAISVVIIGWDGYFFHDEIVADRYLSLRQAERWMCLWLQKMNISSIGVHSLMRVWNGWEKANMNTCHFGGEIKADSSTDIAWDGGTSYQDNSIGKMHKVQERRCATPYSFENRDWLPFVIDSHAWEIAKAKGAESEAKEVLKTEHTAEKKEKPSSWVGRKTKAYRKGWLGDTYFCYSHHLKSKNSNIWNIF